MKNEIVWKLVDGFAVFALVSVMFHIALVGGFLFLSAFIWLYGYPTTPFWPFVTFGSLVINLFSFIMGIIGFAESEGEPFGVAKDLLHDLVNKRKRGKRNIFP